MASTTSGRALAIGVLVACAAFGGYATFGAGTQNGLFESLQSSAGHGAQERHFICGPSPHKTTYTGIKAIDDQLFILVAFFVLIVDCPSTWDVKVVYWCLMAELCAAWVFIRLEGHRAGNRGRIVSWTGTFGAIFQNITFTVTAPIYFIIHLLTSPTSGSNPAPDDLTVDPVDSKHLPHRTVLSFVIPAMLMALPSPSVLSAGAHYAWLAIWQLFPIVDTLYHWLGYELFSHITPLGDKSNNSPAVARGLVVRAQRFILYLCFIPRTIAMTAALTPAALVPQVLRPVFEQLTLGSLFVPYWPWNSPSASDPASPAGKPELAQLFLQWDVLCGGLAILTWAGFAYLAALPDKGLLRNVLPKVLLYGAVGGPVAVATMLVVERDAAVLERSGKGRRE